MVDHRANRTQRLGLREVEVVDAHASRAQRWGLQEELTTMTRRRCREDLEAIARPS